MDSEIITSNTINVGNTDEKKYWKPVVPHYEMPHELPAPETKAVDRPPLDEATKKALIELPYDYMPGNPYGFFVKMDGINPAVQREIFEAITEEPLAGLNKGEPVVSRKEYMGARNEEYVVRIKTNAPGEPDTYEQSYIINGQHMIRNNDKDVPLPQTVTKESIRSRFVGGQGHTLRMDPRIFVAFNAGALERLGGNPREQSKWLTERAKAKNINLGVDEDGMYSIIQGGVDVKSFSELVARQQANNLAEQQSKANGDENTP